MNAILWMAGGSALCWLAILLFFGPQAGSDALLGMAGPLVVAIGTFVAAERIYRRHPEQLTGLMAAAFAGKMVFFGAYVVIALRVLAPRPLPFIVSFTTSFIVLHLIEGLSLRRLFTGASDISSKTA